MAREHTDNGSSTHPTETTALSRKKLLCSAGAGAGALVLGSALGAAPAAAQVATRALRLGRAHTLSPTAAPPARRSSMPPTTRVSLSGRASTPSSARVSWVKAMTWP